MAKRFLFSAPLLLVGILAFSIFAEAQTEFSAAPPVKKYFPGEKLTYEIHYLGLPVGEAVSEIYEVENFRGRRAYRVHVKVRSYPVIDWIYKVRDEHDSWIDFQSLASLGYQKKIREGRRRVFERMEFDLENRRARLFDETGKITGEIEIPEGAQDALSSGYFARTLDLKENSSVFIPVFADKKVWNLEVKTRETQELEIKSVGKFSALRTQPLMEFQGIFIRKGKVEGLMSLDARRIPLTMQVSIPVLGRVAARLVKYEAGKESE